jgi:hypothetical protein
MAGGPKRSSRQERAIAALLTCRTIAEAAAAVGIAERTLAGWLKVPAFASAYRAARRQVVELAVSRLQGVTGEAVDTLQGLLAAESESVRLGAAKGILEFAQQAVAIGDLLERVEALERGRVSDGPTFGREAADPVGGNGHAVTP